MDSDHTHTATHSNQRTTHNTHMHTDKHLTHTHICRAGHTLFGAWGRFGSYFLPLRSKQLDSRKPKLCLGTVTQIVI